MKLFGLLGCVAIASLAICSNAHAANLTTTVTASGNYDVWEPILY